MAPEFLLELPYLSIGIAKVDIFSEPANFSVKIFTNFTYFLHSGGNPKGILK